MGRIYAGILGMIAYATAIARGVIEGGSLEATLKAASILLFLFAALGYVFGQMAEDAITQSLRTQLDEQRKIESEQLEARKSADAA